jgi:TnpA family transposase
MPRRSILSKSEQENLYTLPETKDEIIRLYTFNEADLSIINQRRGRANCLGFAIQLCYMRYPGVIFGLNEAPSALLLTFVAKQLKIDPNVWIEYGKREQTRREHLVELQTLYGFKTFSARQHYPSIIKQLEFSALRTDKGIVLALELIEYLQQKFILLPPIGVIDRICAEAITRANRHIYDVLTEQLTSTHHQKLDELLKIKEGSTLTMLGWLRQSPAKANSVHMNAHIERLKTLQAIDLPMGIERQVHQNRLLKIAREGAKMTSADLARLETKRRYATLVALAIESLATVTDEIIDLHDRIMGKMFATAKNKHQKQFHSSGKAINDKIRQFGQIGKALLTARENGSDAFMAIESVMSWDAFSASVAEVATLAQENFDSLHLVVEIYGTLRRYSPALLEILKLRAAPAAQEVMAAIDVIRKMNASSTRKLPKELPIKFIKDRWRKLVFTGTEVDARYYELCALTELKDKLRSGDIWVLGSRQFKDFEEYLMPPEQFTKLRRDHELPLAITTDCEQYLSERLALFDQKLQTVNRLALANDLPDAILTDSGLKVTPLDAVFPDDAQTLIDQVSSALPHIKITELLLEVDEWTGFSGQFTHLKTGDAAKDKILLLTAILSDAINLGLGKMAESCPGTTYSKLSWLQSWHIRDDSYLAALATLTNAQIGQSFAEHWGDGTSSSSDGQRFRAGGRAQSTGHVNPKYGSEPGRLVYTHVSDQYAPFSSKLINVGVHESTYVLDGLLYHESDLRIDEHYTDTGGFTDHVFALMHLLGFRFAPRIRGLSDTKLFIPKGSQSYLGLKAMISSESLNIRHLRTHWDELLRLATSIKEGTVTASLMMRKLSSYPRQNGLALALREFGRIERTLFILDWLQSVELRRRVQAGLNKGEARNALARAVFFNRLGEIRDRSYEQQRYRASGLNLATAAIVLWNTVYIERAINTMIANGKAVNTEHLKYLSPLGWEHINLTGDYTWKNRIKVGSGKFRPLRGL